MTGPISARSSSVAHSAWHWVLAKKGRCANGEGVEWVYFVAPSW
jgi:hypothetical protein